MHKFVEMIEEKYLSKDIENIVGEICGEHFEAVFKKHCELQIKDNDTTLGRTYRELELLAYEATKKIMNEHMDKINFHQAIKADNLFYSAFFNLWDTFEGYLDFKGWVKCFIEYEWAEKEPILKEKGIIDEHGDYIQQNG